MLHNFDSVVIVRAAIAALFLRFSPVLYRFLSCNLNPKNTVASAKLTRVLGATYLLSACIANLLPQGCLGVVSTLASWIYLVPPMILFYTPVLVPSLVLPDAALVAYSETLAAVGGLTITEDLSVDSVAHWFPQEYIKGEHLPEHFRGVFWMDGNGGCKGSGCSDIASLAAGHWEPQNRVLTFPLYAPHTFSHHPACYGDVLRAVAWGWTYVFHFDETLEEANITLRVLGVDLPTGAMGSFHIRASGPAGDRGQTWDRPSWLGKKDGDPNHIYYLRRLVDQHGTVNHTAVHMFERAYTPSGASSAVQGYGATKGVCTHPNQVIRTK